jgi:hypothetical protein
MDNIEKEKLATIRLIESWNNENVIIALEIMKGNRQLKTAVKQHYESMLKALFKKVDLDVFQNFPQKLSEILRSYSDIPYYECLDKALPLVPIYRLNLSHSKIEVFPWWILKMPQLTEINLSNNEITLIPDNIDELYNLEMLNLTGNNIHTIPDAVGRLSKLEKLQLDFNNIEIIPDSIGNLSKLTWLCLEANKIESLPKSLMGLSSLYWLSIEKTPLGEKHNVLGGTYTNVNESFFQNLLK